MQKVREECGVFGIFSPAKNDLAHLVYCGLFSLQHRGQEACGIVVNDDGVFTSYKDKGLVNDVFNEAKLKGLGDGNIAIGHVRYGTTGTNDRLNAQPIVVKHIKGSMALAHNGNLVNSYDLRNELEHNGMIFHTTSDTEVISYIITRERLTAPSIEVAVERAMNTIKGAYSIVVMSPSKLIIARDPNGFRPLCYGLREDGSYVAASETCALDAVGATFVEDVKPGEIIVFTPEGIRKITTHCNKATPSLCVFEYIYFARPDSVIDGFSVHEARIKAGRFLAMDYKVDADIVIGVPDSGIDAAIGYSMESGIPYGIGFIKNKYVGRTFIAPNQKQREDLVRLKLNVISAVVKDKKIVLVDDSIVRGTTSARIIKLLRDAGAKEVHMRVTAPPFTNPCYYGTDIDSRNNLIACRYSLDEIAKMICVDTLGYLKLERVNCLAGDGEKGYCSACFDGKYPTDIPRDIQKDKFESKINQKD